MFLIYRDSIPTFVFCFGSPQVFGFEVPTELPGVPTKVLSPRDAWSDKESYDATRTKLAGMFKDNFTKFVKVYACVRPFSLEANDSCLRYFIVVLSGFV